MAKLIGITGPSCSGKSTVCRKIEDKNTKRIPLDNFYREEVKNNNYDHPRAIKFKEARRTLEKLKKEEKTTTPIFNKKKLEITGKRELEPHPLNLVDGFMLLHDEQIREILDKSIYLDIPKKVQLERRRKRFEEGSLYMDEDYFHDTVYPAQKKYIEPTKKYADHVLNADRDVQSIVDDVKSIIHRKN